MAVRKTITVPNPILRRKSKPITLPGNKKNKKLVANLIETAKAAKEPKGVGLSAIQIGQPVRAFVIKRDKKFVPFINPKITWRSKKTFSQALEKDKLFLEGCLSIPDYYGFVNRPYAIKLEWQDLENKTRQEKFENKESAYVQHELDHLNGILFIDRLLKQKNQLYKVEKDKDGKEALVEVEIQ